MVAIYHPNAQWTGPKHNMYTHNNTLRRSADLVEEPELHEQYEAGDAEEHVGPEEHVDVVHEVDAECGQLQHQLRVVGIGVPVLPGPVVVHVP